MKRKIIASVLGIAASAAMTSAYGQGQVLFNNYFATSSGSGIVIHPEALITYALTSPLHPGQTVGGQFSVDFMYSVNSGATWLPGNDVQPIVGGNDGDPASAGAGIYGGTAITINPYTSGAVWFQIEAFNGTSYSDPSTTYNGLSGIVKMSGLATGINNPGDMFADNPQVTQALTAWTVNAVPEPTALALAGMGGLAALIALRRKQA